MKTRERDGKKVYYVYILKGYLKRSRKKTIYIGYTSNIKDRVGQHIAGKKKGGALRTSMMKSLTLIYVEKIRGRANAMRREKELKKIFNHMSAMERRSFIERPSNDLIAIIDRYPCIPVSKTY